MKHFLIIGFLLCSLLHVKSQTLFFDQLPNSTWTSKTPLCDSTGTYKKIGLSKCAPGSTELPAGTIVWEFNRQLKISCSQPGSEKKVLTTYTYKVDEEKGRLHIYTETGIVSYKVGIVSTGNYALLTQKKTKHKNTMP